jgi:hypothetical protein
MSLSKGICRRRSKKRSEDPLWRGQEKKSATVRRYIATIGRAHVGAGLLGRETSAGQAQARALGWREIGEFIECAGENIGKRIVRVA